MRKHILLVDDDVLLRASLAFNLTQAGYRASTAPTAEEGLVVAQRDAPALTLLDVSLPGMDGFEALGRFRALVGNPVILLTARADEMDEAGGLARGADDYVIKPFSFMVLLARINTALRRYEEQATSRNTTVQVGDVTINSATHQVYINHRPVELRPREFGVLFYLAERAGIVVTAEELLANVWGTEYLGEPQVVYVTISRLREKLERDPQRPQRIVSMRGIGYKLMP